MITQAHPGVLALTAGLLAGSAVWAEDAAPGTAFPAPAIESLEEMARRLLAEDALSDPVEDGDDLIEAILDERTGGLADARRRGFLRMAVAPDPLMIAFDGEEALGVAIVISQEMEKYLATLPDASPTPTVVVPTPTPRGRIEDGLAEGQSDFATLTVRTIEENEALDYTQPLIDEVADVVVLSPDVEGIDTLDDLAAVPLFVQEGGRYARVIETLNDDRVRDGLPPLQVKYVDERLDDYDLVEMAEVGVIPATVMTNFKAEFWSQVYDSVTVRDDLTLSGDARIAWAVRAENPELLAALDGFAGIAKKGTLLGNVVLQKYVESADWIENIGAENVRRLIDEVGPVIRRYSDEYDFEFELVLAQAYQESRLDQSRVSHVGARGVMQVMPATAADPAVGIPDISSVENNVHAGVRYLRWLRDTYFDDPEIDPLDRTLLTFAAYNAGPGGVLRARKLARRMGLDPDRWFENVELAIQKAVSREPAIYVRNIFKYYVSYRLLSQLEAESAAARAEIEKLPEEIADLTPQDAAELLETETNLVVGDNAERTAAGRSE